MKDISSNQVVRILIYLCIFFSTFNASFVSFELFSYQVSLFRIILIVTILISLIDKKMSLFKPVKQKYFYYFMIGWFIYSIISYFWIFDFYAWFETLYFIGLGLISLVIISKYITSKKHFFICIIIFSFAVCTHILIGSFEFITSNYFYINPEYLLQYQYNNWPVSTFTNTNNYAFFLSLSICFILFIIKYCSNNKIKIFYYFITCVSILLICATQSRGVILALIISIILLLINKHVLNKKQFKVFLIISLGIAFVCLVTVVTIGFLNINHLNLPHNSNTIRYNLTLNSLYFTSKTFFLGVGAGNFEYWITNFSLVSTSGITNSHNWWLEILSEYGIIVLTGYLIYIFKIYQETKKDSNDKFSESFRYCIFLFLITFSIGCISPSSILEMEWLWLLFALIITGMNICDGGNNEDINNN
ncbi:MAG: O-antigen ligase family protein [bacterium]